jgi:hypothetical protein
VSECGKYLNTLGLLFGIVGVALLFVWGPPQPSFEQGGSIGLEDGTRLQNEKTVAENNADIAAREKRHKIMSRIGLALVGLSFALQLWAVWA